MSPFASTARIASTPTSPASTPCETIKPVRSLYLDMLANPVETSQRARDFLLQQLAVVHDTPPALPSVQALDEWSRLQTERVGEAYQAYLASRKAGGARCYFEHRAAALQFIRSVGPTKLVDGAWLYGMLRHWEDPVFHGLIRTYLEELGDGQREQNHVALYQSLLAKQDETLALDLPEDHYVQGAIQLALAALPKEFLPEIVGYNLGYEQLPLHLLISSYELNELGIDPYYFTLHVTIDNPATGHAAKAIAAVRNLMARAPDPAQFYRRVASGYALNDLGASTTSVIAGFDLDAELGRVLAEKSVAGKNMHGDYCKIGGRTVNEWLSAPENMPAFLQAMQQGGWITRGQPAPNSRFWSLVEGARAAMFGVFSPYEKELLRTWIERPESAAPTPAPRVASHRALERARQVHAPATATTVQRLPRALLRQHAPAANDAQCEANPGRLFEQELAKAADKPALMALLASKMGPESHHTPLGLMATRIFSQALGA